jgi:hypothetical protein
MPGVRHNTVVDKLFIYWLQHYELGELLSRQPLWLHFPSKNNKTTAQLQGKDK